MRSSCSRPGRETAGLSPAPRSPPTPDSRFRRSRTRKSCSCRRCGAGGVPWLWSHAPHWQPTARLTTWLHRVALNLCLDVRRRGRDVALDDVAEPLDPAPSPLACVQVRDLGRHVNTALAELPVQQRVAITLCHYQGLRNTEAAEVMGVSVEAVESLLAREDARCARVLKRCSPICSERNAALMDHPSTMSLERLRALLDAYGANPDRWPPEERMAALALLEQSPRRSAGATRVPASMRCWITRRIRSFGDPD